MFQKQITGKAVKSNRKSLNNHEYNKKEKEFT